MGSMSHLLHTSERVRANEKVRARERVRASEIVRTRERVRASERIRVSRSISSRGGSAPNNPHWRLQASKIPKSSSESLFTKKHNYLRKTFLLITNL